MDLSNEIILKTTRSGGKGGQNVNKVETAVIGYWSPAQSQLLTPQQTDYLLQKLAAKLNKEGFLQVRSETYRTQLENRQEVIRRINDLVAQGLKKKKPRVATKPSRRSMESRLEHKKRRSEKKEGRRRIDFRD